MAISVNDGAKQLVDRARAGDQVAIATISLVSKAAKKGVPKAKVGLMAIKKYIRDTPNFNGESPRKLPSKLAKKLASVCGFHGPSRAPVRRPVKRTAPRPKAPTPVLLTHAPAATRPSIHVTTPTKKPARVPLNLSPIHLAGVPKPGKPPVKKGIGLGAVNSGISPSSPAAQAAQAVNAMPNAFTPPLPQPNSGSGSSGGGSDGGGSSGGGDGDSGGGSDDYGPMPSMQDFGPQADDYDYQGAAPQSWDDDSENTDDGFSDSAPSDDDGAYSDDSTFPNDDDSDYDSDGSDDGPTDDDSDALVSMNGEEVYDTVANMLDYEDGPLVAAVLLSHGPLLSNSTIAGLTSSFGSEERTGFAFGVRNPRKRTRNKHCQVGQCIGLARKIQAVRHPQVQVSTLSPMAGWEFGEDFYENIHP